MSARGDNCGLRPRAMSLLSSFRRPGESAYRDVVGVDHPRFRFTGMEAPVQGVRSLVAIISAEPGFADPHVAGNRHHRHHQSRCYTLPTKGLCGIDLVDVEIP